jgi:hypothetical protein
MECAPGEEAQVDFGTGAPVIGADGKRRKTYDQPFQHEFTLPVSPNLAKMGRKGWFRFDLKG